MKIFTKNAAAFVPFILLLILTAAAVQMRSDCFHGCFFFRDEPGTEQLSLNSVSEYFFHEYGSAGPVEINSAFYYKFILYPWKEWKNSQGDFTAAGYRQSSLIGALLTFLLTYFLGRKVKSPWTGLLAVSLLTVNACHFYYSQYMRYHIFSMAAACISVFSFWKTLKKPTASNWIIYNLVSAVNIYISLNNITLLPAQWIILALYAHKKHGSLKNWPKAYLWGLAASAAVSVISFLPMPFYDKGALGRMNHYAPIGWPILLSLYCALAGIKQYLASWEAAVCLGSAALVVSLGIKSAWKEFAEDGRIEKLTLTAWLIVPVLLHIIISAAVQPIIITRNLIFIMPPFCILYALGIQSAAKNKLWTAAALIIWSVSIPVQLHQCGHDLYYEWDMPVSKENFLPVMENCCLYPGDHLQYKNNDLLSALKLKLKELSAKE